MESYGTIDVRRNEVNENAKKWGHIGMSVIGVGLGLGGSITGFHFKNMHLGSWGLASGSFAAVILHLAVLHKAGLVDSWYSANILAGIIKLGIVGTIFGIIGTAAYITIAVVQHQGHMLPNSFYYSSIGSCVTICWCLYLIFFAWKLKREMERANPPLLNFSRPYPGD
ncbi:hypothetical protein CHUAL_000977 [Chamberlinius hualienensis]